MIRKFIRGTKGAKTQGTKTMFRNSRERVLNEETGKEEYKNSYAVDFANWADIQE